MGVHLRLGIIETDNWLREDRMNPVAICERFKHLFSNEEPEEIYRFLQNHGMYTKAMRLGPLIDKMIEEKVWIRAKSILNKLQKGWNGPDIPVYIFPLRSSGFLSRALESKSGLAFADKLFLFIKPDISEIELKALIIHEYHHVCRLKKYKKSEWEYTLLDSMVMEGLAEHTVKHYVGEKGLAQWTSLYKDSELEKLWNSYIKENTSIKRDTRLHDKLLVGRAPYPKMLGYSIGYYLIRKAEPFEIKHSFSIDSKKFIEGII